MKAFRALSLTILFSTPAIISCQELQEWPYNLPADTKYFPEEEVQARKYASIHKRLAQTAPNAIRKMNADDGEMFFLDYWGFPEDYADPHMSLNSSSDITNFQPAILRINNETTAPGQVHGRFVERSLAKRDFQCPSGTNVCSNIGRSDACCPSGLTCNLITNTGGGDVGCCAGSSCSGQLSGCASGYTECQGFGGGCCIPGYACVSGGCILTATETVVVTPTTPSTTSIPPSTTSPQPTTSTTSASTCSSGFNSCPATLGGGCCPTSMICGPSTSCIPSSSSRTPSTSPSPTSTSAPTSSAPPIAPNRPTSIVSTTQSLSSIPATTTACPTGFYQCSAYYNSGACCQVGRNCGMTSCPAASSSSVLVSDGVTVVVGNGGAAATAANNAGGQKGSCATGWFTCAASLGGNCCPTGFNCGTASCWLNATAGAAETGSTGKETAGGERNGVTMCVMLSVVVSVTFVIVDLI